MAIQLPLGNLESISSGCSWRNRSSQASMSWRFQASAPPGCLPAEHKTGLSRVEDRLGRREGPSGMPLGLWHVPLTMRCRPSLTQPMVSNLDCLWDCSHPGQTHLICTETHEYTCTYICVNISWGGMNKCLRP